MYGGAQKKKKKKCQGFRSFLHTLNRAEKFRLEENAPHVVRISQAVTSSGDAVAWYIEVARARLQVHTLLVLFSTPLEI